MVPHRRRPGRRLRVQAATLVAEGGEERYARGAEPGSVECRADGAVRRPGRGERDEAPARLGEAAEHGDRTAARARHGIQTIRPTWR
ncbi:MULTISPECIES: hypothetical protein [unclassified Streptomyces]|uniref:hypothetical protein n=1 Tax=unclassified Streptomyces TaxID=2593676 RepID=UPI0004C8908F|nr:MULTISPECIES: hypothetical protein [unclassified Streptomyces]KOV77743.1 hypothetical protein ADL02_26705 [Streptomyces sp. NRRL WC-3723]